MRRGWSTGMVAVVLAVATTATATSAVSAEQRAATAAAPPISTPGDVSRISLAETATVDGWRYDTYRNLAYPCSISGYQSFTVGTRSGSAASQAAPLWTFLHGGGTGYFDATGRPRPDQKHLIEEAAQKQRQNLTDVALTQQIRSVGGPTRLLAVSMCNRDIYGGVGLPDPNNPNTTPDGRTRTTNGLFHTKAAIQFATTRYRTNDTFLYGGSAGAFGTFHVARGLQLQGLAPAGLVADSGVLNIPWQEATQTEPGCGRSEQWADVFPRRLHPTITDGTTDPDLLVAGGALTVPVLHVWSINDPGQCGVQPVACPLRDGSTPTLGSVDCLHEPLRRAIAAQGAQSRSYSMRLCVSPPDAPGTCTVHTPSTKPAMVNTLAGEPADFNAKILDWVQQRTRDDQD